MEGGFFYRNVLFISGDKEFDNEKSVEITETSESVPEESKKTEESVDAQISPEPKAENGSSQTTFHVLGGFEEKTVQKVAGKILPSPELICIECCVF